MSTLRSRINIAFTGSGTGSIVSSNFPSYSSPVFVNNPIFCSTPGPCINYALQNSIENPTGPWSFTLTATADPGSTFVGWTTTPNCGTSPGLICPASSVNASQVFSFVNSDIDYTITAQFDLALIPCDPITLVDDGPFSMFLNEPFSQTLVPVGGSGPYTFTVNRYYQCPGHSCGSPATLPVGITLNSSTGVLSGTPTSVPPCSWIPINISYTTESGPCFSTVCIELVVAARPLPTCYELIACDGSRTIKVTNTELSQYVSQIVQIMGECFTVQIAQDCVRAITLQNLVIVAFQDCCSCNPPKVYTLTDCTTQTAQIITTTDLSAYVGSTAKVCEFVANPTILIDGISVPCMPPNLMGFVTRITGPTTGLYHDVLSNQINPYTNPTPSILTVGDQICIDPITFNVVSSFSDLYIIQFFIGSTPITSSIIINTSMPVSELQWLISQSIIPLHTTIIVNSFDNINHLSVTVISNQELVDPILNVASTPLTNPIFPPTATVTENMIGQCTCYTVADAGTSCNQFPPFTGVILETFPDCECCLPSPPEDPEPEYEQEVPEIDKHTYTIVESECDIEANKKFANAMYDIFKTDAYGIESCCPRNFNQIWIQKELSDLSKLKNNKNVCS